MLRDTLSQCHYLEIPSYLVDKGNTPIGYKELFSLDENEISKENIIVVRVSNKWKAFRDDLAKEMFEKYQFQHHHVI